MTGTKAIVKARLEVVRMEPKENLAGGIVRLRWSDQQGSIDPSQRCAAFAPYIIELQIDDPETYKRFTVGSMCELDLAVAEATHAAGARG